MGIIILQPELNTRDHLLWTTGNRDSMHEVCILHRIPRADNSQTWKKSGRNESGHEEESLKRGLTNAKDITLMLPWGGSLTTLPQTKLK